MSALVALMILLVASASRINIGLRHILPDFPFLAMVGGYGAAQLWRLRPCNLLARFTLVGLLTWQMVCYVRAHPDYFAYFNELAGPQPERILIHDLDWGQDLLRLQEALRDRGVQSVSIAYNGSADLARHQLPPFRRLQPNQPTTGWIAVSQVSLRLTTSRSWLLGLEPVARVGHSIL
ncbi:MAG: hypothetical protein ACREB3_04505, partial [Burkholderiales bacterium]